jgi:4-hydroxy-tetrahydrodipicolinate synthase
MFRGSLVALVTPMKAGVAADTPLDWPALEALIDFHVAQGTSAIVSVGTTGESATLDEDEHSKVIRFTVEKAAGRIPVIGGTGANSTSEAIRLTQCAKDAGVDACLLVTPYYNKPTQEGLYQHHKAVADAVDVRQILYNVPGRTACDMLPETVARLAEVPNIVAIKEATAELERVRQLKSLCGPDFGLLSGDDATAREFMSLGGDGVISVTANVAPAGMAAMCAAALNGDREQSSAIDARLLDLHRELFAESNPIPTKWALAELGLIEAGIRLPLTWLSASCQPALRQAMETAEVSAAVAG